MQNQCLLLNTLTKITVILFVILFFSCVYLMPYLSTPANVTNYLNSLYPFAQNQTTQNVDGWLSEFMEDGK